MSKLIDEDMDYYPLPKPSEIPIKEREDAMGSYLMMFAAIGAGLPLPFLNILASVIYFYIHRKKGPFVKFHLIQSLWSQIPVSLLNGVIVVWLVTNFFNNSGFTGNFYGLMITVIILNIIYLIFSVYAAVKARQGRIYYFIFFGRISYELAFKIRDEDRVDEPEEDINLPPQ